MEEPNDAEPTFYPAFCFKASPTHFAWVKMALADVHKLHKPKNFDGQKLFFYKNHPITFINVVGVIVARTEIARRTILTIDDSSGATLDVVVLHADPKEKVTTENPAAAAAAAAALASTSTSTSASTSAASWRPFAVAGSSSASISSNRAKEATDTSSGEIPDLVTMNQTVHVSATDRTIIDISKLVPGIVIKAKGTVNSFRSTMQMNLERFNIIHDTNAEMQFVDERLQFFVDVLSVPWFLDDEEIDLLQLEARRGMMEAAEERGRAEQRVRKRVEREERDRRHIQKRYERDEKKRAKEAGVCKESGRKVMIDRVRREALEEYAMKDVWDQY